MAEFLLAVVVQWNRLGERAAEFRGESGGKWEQTWVQGAQWGGLSPCERSQHVRGANPMYEVHLK